jgi:hypothetical protein
LHNELEIKGKWRIIEPRFQYLPVHVALLHTGKVLAFGGSGNNPKKLHKSDPPELFEPDYTGNTDGKISSITQEGIEGDVFCVGHAFLPDGKLFLAGGTFQYDGLLGKPFPLPFFWGLEHTYIFDPEKLSWTRVKNMRHGRWYPTCVMLPDGKIATFAGLSKLPPWVILPFNEIYSPEENKWQYIKGGTKFLPLYPRIHLLPNGELFYSGSYNTHLTFPFSLWGFKIATFSFTEKKWKDLPHPPKELHRQEGSSVLLPLLPEENYLARIILIGGGDTVANNATDTVEMIEFKPEETPRYKPIQGMKNKRYYVYPVILPDQNVLVVGGKTGHGGHPKKHKCEEIAPGELKHNQMAVRDTELFITKDGKWITLARMEVDRLYHSNAILLPDGSVMTMGSNPMRECNESRVEIFSPPYLFRGERPKITSCPKELDYGQTFEIETANDSKIKSVAFIRPSTTTHCLNPEQRYVGLTFQQSLSKIIVNIPTNRNVLPPGYYMLFITNERDVPCIAPFVKILI